MNRVKALILCAGYATRMYPLTKNRPKALLTVAGRPIVEHILEKLEDMLEIDTIYIVTNVKFFLLFKNWQKTYCGKKKILILSDGTTSDDNKLGAVGDITFVIDHARINDNLLVVAGDNLFTFNLYKLVQFFRKKGITIAVHELKNKSLIKKYNEVRLDNQHRILSLVEKPVQPTSTLAAICLYILPRDTLKLIHEYIKEGNNPDEPGRYVEWLYKRERVFGYVFTEPWYDIGDVKQYEQANKEFTEQCRED
ncbi:MAG: nucleotidyltransferase family protein [candidate division WOR-3 bacterium]|nr:MAG: nucleotidyltransferase family protein [candidate division WOR-3 bacterium]